MTATATATATTQVLNPLIQAARDTFGLMLDSQVIKGDVSLHTIKDEFFPLTAVIGLAGAVRGSVCLSFSRELAANAVRQMAGIEGEVDSDLLRDTVGEFTNVIAGSAKDMISDEVSLGLPNVICGDNVKITFPDQACAMRARFDTDLGPFFLVFGLEAATIEL